MRFSFLSALQLRCLEPVTLRLGVPRCGLHNDRIIVEIIVLDQFPCPGIFHYFLQIQEEPTCSRIRFKNAVGKFQELPKLTKNLYKIIFVFHVPAKCLFRIIYNVVIRSLEYCVVRVGRHAPPTPKQPANS